MNHPSDILPIPDTQSEHDGRRLAIQQVGIRGVRYPLRIQLSGGLQQTVALWSLDVALPADKKGTHMSRLVAWLDDLHAKPGAPGLAEFQGGLQEMLQRLDAQEGRIEASFAFFIEKRAPVSGVTSLLDYQGRWIVERRDGQSKVWCEASVPVKSLCPCSKEISDYGAHNQRSLVTITAQPLQAVPWEDLVRFAEDSASSEVWPLLKRPDEKWITERAYENPKFVEDLVRDVALRLNADPRIGSYRVDVENFESIHNHSAFARIERG